MFVIILGFYIALAAVFLFYLRGAFSTGFTAQLLLGFILMVLLTTTIYAIAQSIISIIAGGIGTGTALLVSIISEDIGRLIAMRTAVKNNQRRIRKASFALACLIALLEGTQIGGVGQAITIALHSKDYLYIYVNLRSNGTYFPLLVIVVLAIRFVPHALMNFVEYKCYKERDYKYFVACIGIHYLIDLSLTLYFKGCVLKSSATYLVFTIVATGVLAGSILTIGRLAGVGRLRGGID